MSHWPSYKTLQAALAAHGSDCGPAELQGMQLGLLCGDSTINEDNFLSTVIAELNCSQAVGEKSECYGLILQCTEALLGYLCEVSTEVPFEFPLFVPDDEAPLSEQANALSCWCKGFLFGLGLAKVDIKKLDKIEAREALKDISEIARLPVLEESSVSDDDASDLLSIGEYLRVAVMVVYVALLEKAVNPKAAALH